MSSEPEPISLALRNEVRNRRLRTGGIAVVLGSILTALGAFSAYTEVEGYGHGGSINLGIYAGAAGLALLIGGIAQMVRGAPGEKSS